MINIQRLIDDAKCYETVRELCWPDGVRCPHRGSAAVNKRGHDEDGDGFHEVHVNTMEGFWSLLRSWLRPHRGISQEQLPLYLAFFEFVHNIRRRGKALLGSLLASLLVA